MKPLLTKLIIMTGIVFISCEQETVTPKILDHSESAVLTSIDEDKQLQNLRNQFYSSKARTDQSDPLSEADFSNVLRVRDTTHNRVFYTLPFTTRLQILQKPSNAYIRI